ncbi:MAG: hypothetical protein QNJ46_22475 [Leptolyngbyaceae cyanobacterium MO_188.B28]|nr:hypothetical protein [Leptolyngbyaceae cyanobacterium MO_188.B28]
MQKIKLFLASSSELKADREQFEIFIYRKCKAWFERGVFLYLDIWEDFLDVMAAGGLQSEYNKVIRDCDIFVLLAFNKVGKYTAEEFEQAFGQFSEVQKPFIFTYFKVPTTTTNREDIQSLWAFEDKLKELKHYKTEYQNIEGLREHFGNQLDKLAADGFAKLQPAPDSKQESDQKADPGTTATVSGEGNKVYQNIKDSTITDSSKTYNIEKIESARFE